MKRFLLPLGIFIALLLFLGIGLRKDPRQRNRCGSDGGGGNEGAAMKHETGPAAL